MSYYHIARLKRGHGITFSESGVAVDLAQLTPDDSVKDDIALHAARHPDAFFFVSGGGTLLVNGRYLLVVLREPTARVNPGHWSIFTGRAEGPSEWEQPNKVVRELFEEMVLYSPEGMLYPVCPRFQAIIDEVYKTAGRKPTDNTIALREVPLSTGILTVSHGDTMLCSLPVFFHVNARNDINLLFLFAVEFDLARLAVSDGEAGNATKKRLTAALDLKTMQVIDISKKMAPDEWKKSAALPLTEHLAAMVTLLRENNYC